MLAAAISGLKYFGKIFERELFIRTLPTTLDQIFREIILHFLVFVKGTKNADENQVVILRSWKWRGCVPYGRNMSRSFLAPREAYGEGQPLALCKPTLPVDMRMICVRINTNSVRP